MALNNLEIAVLYAMQDQDPQTVLDLQKTEEALSKKALPYDKDGEEHYNLISALHKSMRGGDPQASLYWLYRMLTAGEDPLFICRRMIRFATEDIGLADPDALQVALAAFETWQKVGPPEAELALAEAAVYLATAPKSNALYLAETAVKKEIEHTGSQPVPLHIRNAPTMVKPMAMTVGFFSRKFANATPSMEICPSARSTKTMPRPTTCTPKYDSISPMTMLTSKALSMNP